MADRSSRLHRLPLAISCAASLFFVLSVSTKTEFGIGSAGQDHRYD